MSTSCQADRRDLYARAAAVARHRAELALPVRVADAEPFRLHEEPVPELDCARTRFEAEPEPRATTHGRPKLAQRASETGERPPKQATGPKTGSKKRQQPSPFAQPAISRPKRPVDSPQAANVARIASERTALDAKARRLEQFKQIWRAGA